MGRADSALLQIVSFITSVRDAAEPRNLVTFSKNLMDNKILNMEMTNFQTESSDMAIFGKSPCIFGKSPSGQIAFILP